MWETKRIIRWTLLIVGVLAILTLTATNVYTLYNLRDSLIQGEQKKQIALLEEVVLNVRRSIYQPYSGFNSLELEPIEGSIQDEGQFPDQVREKIKEVAKSPIFSGIYYTPADTDPCVNGSTIYALNYESFYLEPTTNYPQNLCDGVGLVRTKARIELNNFDYRWNTNTEFDAHRSMNIGFINLHENSVIGYLTATIDREYLIDQVIAPQIQQYFDSSKTSSVVWLHDWANNVVLATNNDSVPFQIDQVEERVDFGRMFENWNMKIAFLNNASVGLYQATFTKNMLVLGFSVLLLLGALFYIFYTAQKERSVLQQQADFLANVTHELKTPLAVMQAAGENIADGRVTQPKRIKEYGSHIYQESIRLNKMIEMLLDVARSDYGTTLIHATPQDLDTLVPEVIESQRSVINRKGHRLQYFGTNKPAMVLVDPEHVKVMLTNLIDNAVKYSPNPSEITIRVENKDHQCYVHCTDQGIGIPRAHIKHIFKKFYRVEDALSAKTKGHGLGLSIIKSLMELNQGHVKVKSEWAKGSTFTLCFPEYIADKYEKQLEQQMDERPSPSYLEPESMS
ncbi:MAG: sensor histidine kinase [Bacteroidetes bacterium]|nr:sensor histidine kinase [Bacteroidota bacterium]